MAGGTYDLGGVKYRTDHELSQDELQSLYTSYEEAGLLNTQVQEQQQMNYEAVTKNKGLLNAYKTYWEIDNEAKWEGTNEELTDEYYEQMRWFENNTQGALGLVARLNDVGNSMSEEERQSLAVMFNSWDNIVPFYADEQKKWRGFFDHAEANLLDVTNLLGAVSFGTGAAAGVATKQAAKFGIREALKAGLKPAIHGAGVAGAVGTALSVGNQEARTELGMQDEIDTNQVLTTGLLSAGAGGLIGGGLGAATSAKVAKNSAKSAAEVAETAAEKSAASALTGATDEMAGQTLNAAKQWREVLSNPAITGQARQDARNEFLRNLGDSTRTRLDRNHEGVGHTVTNEQALENGVKLIQDLGIELTDDLTPEYLVNRLYDKYTKGDIALKDSTSFKAVAIKLENEMYEKFLQAWDAEGGVPSSHMASFEKIISISEDLSSMSGRDLQQQSLRQRVGVMSFNDIIADFKDKAAKGQPFSAQDAKVALLKAAEKGPTWKDNMVGGLNEVWINNILGSLVTLMINSGSAAAHMLENNIIDIGGAVRTGNAREMRRAVTTLGRELTAAPAAFRYMLKAVNESKGSIDPGRNFAGDVEDSIGIGTRNYKLSKLLSPKGEGIYKKGEGLRGGVMNALGNFNRLIGSRGMVATDELIKQMTFRGKLRADITDEALQRIGVEGGFKNASEAHRWAKKEFNALMEDHIDAVGRGVAPEDPRLVSALDEARRIAFQEDFHNDPLSSVGRKINEVSTKHPILKQAIPFIRTPTNLVAWAGERTPGLQLLSKDFTARLNSPDPQVSAKAEMALNMGVMYWTAALSTAMSGDLQGAGSTDFKKQRVAEAGDFLPYSIRAEDGTRVQIRRGDPMSRYFMALGAIQDAMVNDHESATDLFASAAIGTAKVLVEVPSLTGIADIFQLATDVANDVDGAFLRFAENRAKTLVPYYRFYRDMLVPEGVDKTMFTNVGLNPVDLMNTAYFQDNPEDPYDKRRDPLGNVINIKDNAGFELSGFAMIEPKDSPIMDELVRLGSTRYAPEPSKYGVDLQDYKVMEGGRQSVYDLWQEQTSTHRIKGMPGSRSAKGATMEEALKHQLQSKVYKQLLGDKKRLQALHSIMSQYQDSAFKVVIKSLGEEHQLVKDVNFYRTNEKKGLYHAQDQYIKDNPAVYDQLNSVLNNQGNQ